MGRQTDRQTLRQTDTYEESEKKVVIYQPSRIRGLLQHILIVGNTKNSGNLKRSKSRANQAEGIKENALNLSFTSIIISSARERKQKKTRHHHRARISIHLSPFFGAMNVFRFTALLLPSVAHCRGLAVTKMQYGLARATAKLPRRYTRAINTGCREDAIIPSDIPQNHENLSGLKAQAMPVYGGMQKRG